MKTFTAFFSMIALGLLAGAVIVTTFTNHVSPIADAGSADNNFSLDHVSLVIGIIIGALTATIARMDLATLPRRIAQWIMANAATFGYLITAVALAAVVIYY